MGRHGGPRPFANERRERRPSGPTGAGRTRRRQDRDPGGTVPPSRRRRHRAAPHHGRDLHQEGGGRDARPHRPRARPRLRRAISGSTRSTAWRCDACSAIRISPGCRSGSRFGAASSSAGSSRAAACSGTTKATSSTSSRAPRSSCSMPTRYAKGLAKRRRRRSPRRRFLQGLRSRASAGRCDRLRRHGAAPASRHGGPSGLRPLHRGQCQASPGRRVSGHQPRAAPADRALPKGWRASLGRRGRRPDTFHLPGRRRPLHARLQTAATATPCCISSIATIALRPRSWRAPSG